MWAPIHRSGMGDITLESSGSGHAEELFSRLSGAKAAPCAPDCYLHGETGGPPGAGFQP
jgi:hypothetical protein